MSEQILSQNRTKLEQALKWLSLGAALLPCQSNSKSLVKGFGPNRQVVKDRQRAEYWFTADGYNMGVLLPGELWCLDFDNDDVFVKWTDATPLDLQETYQETSPRGWHIFYRGALPTGLDLIPGVELKRVVLVAPSRIGNFVYTAVNPGAEIRTVDDYKTVCFSLLSDSLPSDNDAYRQVEHRRPDTPGVSGDDLISRIKARWPVMWLASSLTELRASPPGQERWYIGRCPLHDDEHPSFWVDNERDTWGCFACDKTGDLINLYALANHMDNGEAIRRLAWGLK